jgi:isoamylase
LHVKGFTQLHPQVPPELRGTYAGLAHPAVVDYLVGLGITTVELLPVHQFVTNSWLATRGLVNYWGYDTICFLAPHEAYSAAARAGRRGGQVPEFQHMVRTLHGAGLEVLLDVVYNHTAEGHHLGPTLCHRGLDNPGYYRLDPADRRHYLDTTGTGNSLNVDDHSCLRLIMDSLRYWVTEMHVDGFRFDLATSLAREEGSFDRLAAFFALVGQDPVVSKTKLVAEPWDVGQPDSYSLGHFPALWSEWNGRYRDCVRDFWRGHPGTLSEFATRVAGSADMFDTAGRRPGATINFVTCHDGFTLRDVVSYSRKHNEANGEGNRDGNDDNRSTNCGVEGPTDDPAVLALRALLVRDLLTTLLLSRGVPMMLAGDEIGRTQLGNNNAYCQDGPISWVNWTDADNDLLRFTRRLVAFRRAHPVLRRRRYVCSPEYVTWLRPDAEPMTVSDWHDPRLRSIVIFLDSTGATPHDVHGQSAPDDDLLVLVNGSDDPMPFTIPTVDIPTVDIPTVDIPTVDSRRRWTVAVNTADPLDLPGRHYSLISGSRVSLQPRAILVLWSPHQTADHQTAEPFPPSALRGKNALSDAKAR